MRLLKDFHSQTQNSTLKLLLHFKLIKIILQFYSPLFRYTQSKKSCFSSWGWKWVTSVIHYVDFLFSSGLSKPQTTRLQKIFKCNSHLTFNFSWVEIQRTWQKLKRIWRLGLFGCFCQAGFTPGKEMIFLQWSFWSVFDAAWPPSAFHMTTWVTETSASLRGRREQTETLWLDKNRCDSSPVRRACLLCLIYSDYHSLSNSKHIITHRRRLWFV